jgi:hypothetical protein
MDMVTDMVTDTMPQARSARKNGKLFLTRSKSFSPETPDKQ